MSYAHAGCHVVNEQDSTVIAIFAVRPDGTLESVGRESTQGRKPLFFGPDSQWRHLYAANESSHTIAEFAVDHESGKLTPTGQIVETGSPACIAFKA